MNNPYLVTAAYVATQLKVPVARVLKALRRVGAEPCLILNETCYYEADLANSAQLVLTGDEDIIDKPQDAANHA
jgi:hypothetical protein